MIRNWLVLGLLMCAAGGANAESFSDLHKLNFIVVTLDGPNDGGDFGKNTPGTKTAGIQEALNHLKTFNTGQHCRKHLYIAPGDYSTAETIRVPWMGERFTLEAAGTWINYQGQKGDALVIDSQMNCRFRFGYVSGLNLAEGWIVRLQPVDPGPSSPLPPDRRTSVITCTQFDFNAIVAQGWYQPGITAARRGNGLLLDASKGPITWNRVAISELNTCDVGVHLRGSCSSNGIDVWFNHGCNTHLLVDEQASQNRIDMSIHSENIPDSAGARIFGASNTLNLTLYATSPGRDVIFEPPARDNIIYAAHLPHGITNNAAALTNLIVRNATAGFSQATPPVGASGVAVANRDPWPVQVFITDAGAVSKYTLADARGGALALDGPINKGQSFNLAPGDTLAFTYTAVPAWKWRAAR